MECFSGSNLEEVVFPPSIREVGAKAFYGCKQLKRVQLNESLERLGAREIVDRYNFEGQVFARSAIESVTLPSTLKRIEKETFLECKNIKKIEIPSGVEYIGEYCFMVSGLEEIALPCTLREIAVDAFMNCKSLRVVWLEDDCLAEDQIDVGDSVAVLHMSTMVWGYSLRELWK